jgi:TatA/E family protein of Tat protein translocase
MNASDLAHPWAAADSDPRAEQAQASWGWGTGGSRIRLTPRAPMFGRGPCPPIGCGWELSPRHLILLPPIVLLVLGPGKLPDTGAAIGKAMRDFREALEGKKPPLSNPDGMDLT